MLHIKKLPMLWLIFIGLNPSYAKIDRQQLPNGVTQSEWQNIKSQINSKSIQQTHGVFEQNYLKASNVDEGDVQGHGDSFGSSVAIDGNTLVVGAEQEDDINDSKLSSGAVYVFVKSNGSWVEQAYLKAEDATLANFFGSSVAIDGDTLVIGAKHEGILSGAVYVFTRTSETWSQQQKFKALNTQSVDRFGSSVAVEGDTILVGAPFEDGDDNGGENDSGAAYIFTRTGSTWSQQKYLKASNIGAGDEFGSTVSLSNGTAVIGASLEDGDDSGSEDDSGAAYAFTGSGSNWNFQRKLKALNADAGDKFGISVSISMETIAVGASFERGNGIDGGSDNSVFNAGAVYIFTRSSNSWSPEAYVKPLTVGFLDTFGNAVSLSGDRLLIGARYEDSNGIDGENNNSFTNAGAAYLFTRSGSTWSQQSYLKASNPDNRDEFGFAVAISGNDMVVTAPSEDSADGTDPGNNYFSYLPPEASIVGAGAAYAFLPPDLVFDNGFETPVVMKLFHFLESIKANSQLPHYPIYDRTSDSLQFYGHRLKLHQDYGSDEIIELAKFWLHEILIKEELSGQHGLDVIF